MPRPDKNHATLTAGDEEYAVKYSHYGVSLAEEWLGLSLKQILEDEVLSSNIKRRQLRDMLRGGLEGARAKLLPQGKRPMGGRKNAPWSDAEVAELLDGIAGGDLMEADKAAMAVIWDALGIAYPKVAKQIADAEAAAAAAAAEPSEGATDDGSDPTPEPTGTPPNETPSASA